MADRKTIQIEKPEVFDAYLQGIEDGAATCGGHWQVSYEALEKDYKELLEAYKERVPCEQ